MQPAPSSAGDGQELQDMQLLQQQEQQLRQQLQDKDKQLQALDKQLQDKDKQLQALDKHLEAAGIVTYRGLINSGLHEMVQLPPSQSTGVYHTHPFSVILWTSALQDVLRHQEQVDNTLRKFQRALSTDAPICSKAGAVCEAYRALFVPLNALLQHQAASTRWVVHLSTSPHVSASVAPDAPVHQTSGDDVADPTISRPAKRQRVPWPDVALRLLRDRQCRLGGPTSRVCITVEAKQAAVLGDAADLPAAWNNGNAAVQAVLAQAFGQMDMFQTSLGAILTLKHVWLLQRPEDQPGTVQVSDAIPWTAAGPSNATVLGALDWLRLHAEADGSRKPAPLAEFNTSPPAGRNARQPPPDAASPAAGSAGSGPLRSLQHPQPDRSSPPRTRPRDHSPVSAAAKVCQQPTGKPVLQVLHRQHLQLGAELGEGAAGTVFEGVYGDQRAAVKIMGQCSLWEPAGSYQYEHLVYQKLQMLQGSCVPRVLGHGLIAFYNEYFLALELLHGTPLAQLPQPLEPAVWDGAVSALRQVHALGVLHGDVRLENFVAVPVGREGEGRWRVVVLDFDRAYKSASEESLRKERAELRRRLGVPRAVQQEAAAGQL